MTDEHHQDLDDHGRDIPVVPPRPAGGRRRADVAPDSPSTVEMSVIKRRAEEEESTEAAPAPPVTPEPPATPEPVARATEPAANRRSATSRVNPLAVLALVLPLATVGTLFLVQPASDVDVRERPDRMPLVQATLMCPSTAKAWVGVGDARATGQLSGAEQSVRLAAGTVSQVAGPTIVGDATTSAGLVAAHVDGNQALTCAMPQFDQWFAGVGAGAQHRSTLVLTNPDAGTAVADLAVHGPSGRLGLADLRGISVAGGATVRIDLAERVPRAQDLAVHVGVSRGRLGVQVQDTFEDIETKKRAADWVTPQRRPAAEVRLVGLGTGDGRRTLTVLNPSRNQARVSVQVITGESEFAPTGLDELSLAPGEVRTVDLGKELGDPATSGASGIRVSGSRPVVAGLTSVVGTDLVSAVPVVPLRRAAGLPLPEGAKELVLVGATQQGEVTVRTRNADGTDRAPVQVAVTPGRDHRLPLSGEARWVTVEPADTRVGGIVALGAGKGAVLALWPLVTDDRVPSVRPALR